MTKQRPDDESQYYDRFIVLKIHSYRRTFAIVERIETYEYLCVECVSRDTVAYHSCTASMRFDVLR